MGPVISKDIQYYSSCALYKWWQTTAKVVCELESLDMSKHGKPPLNPFFDEKPDRICRIFTLADCQLKYPKFLILRWSYDLVMMIHGRICISKLIGDVNKTKHSYQQMLNEETTVNYFQLVKQTP